MLTTPPNLDTTMASAATDEDPRRPLTMAIAGAGARGLGYARIAAQFPDRVQIVAVAEPRDLPRQQAAEQFALDPAHVFADWRELAAGPRIADIVVIALLDDQHLPATVAFAERGYDILLEKPVAPTEEECLQIAAAVEAAGVAFAVCHVLRYTPYTLALQQILATGKIGEIVSVEHHEPIGYAHFSHSFVRGNWRREDESSSLLLAKACHDIDWLSAVIGRPAVRVSSFGGLHHFHPGNKPAQAADRCVRCPVESTCPYSAPRLYRRGLRQPDTPEGYFTRVMAPEATEEAVERALAEGPYGRCVYACDNDVVDHQVVQLQYEGGITASFTMTAFTPGANRQTRIFGTRGQVTGDGQHIEIYDFLTEQSTVVDTDAGGHSAADGHGGGDHGLIEAFIDALYRRRPQDIQSGLHESMASHRIVFAAERARRTGTVVEL
jgi:predicted dehydrogenase